MFPQSYARVISKGENRFRDTCWTLRVKAAGISKTKIIILSFSSTCQVFTPSTPLETISVCVQFVRHQSVKMRDEANLDVVYLIDSRFRRNVERTVSRHFFGGVRHNRCRALSRKMIILLSRRRYNSLCEYFVLFGFALTDWFMANHRDRTIQCLPFQFHSVLLISTVDSFHQGLSLGTLLCSVQTTFFSDWSSDFFVSCVTGCRF